MMDIRRLPVVLAVAATCAADFGYVPESITTVPRDNPRGTVELVSFGIAELTPAELPAMSCLHVRLAVGNWRDVGPWHIDLREVELGIRHDRFAPLFINSDRPDLPVAVIPRLQRRIFDLYYLLPPRLAGPNAFTQLDVEWQVKTSYGVETGLTSLAPSEQPLPRTGVTLLVTGWGKHWYIEPTYPWPQFYRRPGPIAHRPPATVEVTRIPDAQPEVDDVDRW